MMKLKYTIAAMAATTLAANAATTVVNTTHPTYSVQDRGDFSLTNTGQTFTATGLGADTNLQTVSFQAARDVLDVNASITVQIWTDTDGVHSTWDPGTMLGASTDSHKMDTALGIYDYSFSGVTLTEGTAYTLVYLSDDADTQNNIRFAVTRNANEASGSYKDGTLFSGGSAPFGDTWDSGFSVTTNTVPEPSSAALLGLGGLALILRRRK